MRAREPDLQGAVERDGVRVGYDVYGPAGRPALGLSMGTRHALQVAARHPERAAGVVAIGSAYPSTGAAGFDVVRSSYEGWATYNRHYWPADHTGFAEHQVHVPHRLGNYRVGRPVAYRPVETDGAVRAARLLAELC